MIKTLEDITKLELIVIDITHEEVLTKYWGDKAFSSMLGDDEEIFKGRSNFFNSVSFMTGSRCGLVI